MSKNYESFIPKAKKLIREKEEKALYLIGELGEGQAKLLAAVGDIAGGSLRQSISHKVYEDAEGKATAIGTDIHYGIYKEKGTGIYAQDGDGRKEVPWIYYDPLTDQYYSTHGIKPEPFLQPITKLSGRFKEIVAKVMGEIDQDG